MGDSEEEEEKEQNEFVFRPDNLETGIPQFVSHSVSNMFRERLRNRFGGKISPFHASYFFLILLILFLVLFNPIQFLNQTSEVKEEILVTNATTTTNRTNTDANSNSKNDSDETEQSYFRNFLNILADYNPLLPVPCDRYRKIPLDLVSVIPSDLVVFLCSTQLTSSSKYNGTFSGYDNLIVKDYTTNFEMIVNRSNSFALRMVYYYCVKSSKFCADFSEAKLTNVSRNEKYCLQKYRLDNVLDLCYNQLGDFTYGILKNSYRASDIEVENFLSIVDYWF